jgi:hypothetical protein
MCDVTSGFVGGDGGFVRAGYPRAIPPAWTPDEEDATLEARAIMAT